jgi:amino acid permease
MPVPGMEWLSRDELLDGLPARKASLLLFAIESRTAQLVARDLADAAFYLPPALAEEQEAAFLAALAAGRELPLTPTIQQIERWAPHWASLAPESASVRAAVAHLLGEKYLFTERDTPQLQTALGLAEPAVLEAYQRFYQRPLEAIYAPQIALPQRSRWAWSALAARLDRLPPFWLAFFLVMPGAAGLLAMPIVLAGLGPLLGVALLALFGLINMLTAVAYAEAATRSNTMHFGLGYIGQLAQEYLGKTGTLLAWVVLALNNFFVLVIFYLGVGATLEGATRVPTEAWMIGVFLVGLFFLSRGSYNATVASTLLIVFVAVSLIILIPLLTLPHVRIVNLVAAARPFASQPFSWSALGPVFGVLLSTFLAHVLIPAYAPVVLRRDPGGRSLVRGSAAAVSVFIIIACLWLVVIQGALPPEVLRSASGTVITPLAALVGPGINLMGSVLVVLGLGLASIQVALALYYQVQEWLGPVGAGGRSPRVRFLLASSPILAVFLLAEWLAINNIGTFANLLGILGALTLPVIAGVIPLMLLVATRRKGDFTPVQIYRWLGNPLVVSVIFIFFVGSIFVHGLLIWDTWLLRLGAMVVGALILAATLLMLRRGILAPRLVVGLHDNQSLHGSPAFHVTCAGEPHVAPLELIYIDGVQTVEANTGPLHAFDRLRSVRVPLSAGPWRELKVWARRTTPELFTVSIAGKVALSGSGAPASYHLETAGGQVLLTQQEGQHELCIDMTPLLSKSDL